MYKGMKKQINEAFGKFVVREVKTAEVELSLPELDTADNPNIDVTNGHSAVASEYVKPAHILS